MCVNNSNSSSRLFSSFFFRCFCSAFSWHWLMHIYHFTVAFHSLSFSHTISLPHAPSSFFLSLLYFTCLCIVSVCTFGNLFLVAGCNFCCYWRRLFTDSGIFRIDSSNLGYVYRNEMIMQSTQMSNSKFSLDATVFRPFFASVAVVCDL